MRIKSNEKISFGKISSISLATHMKVHLYIVYFFRDYPSCDNESFLDREKFSSPFIESNPMIYALLECVLYIVHDNVSFLSLQIVWRQMAFR